MAPRREPSGKSVDVKFTAEADKSKVQVSRGKEYVYFPNYLEESEDDESHPDTTKPKVEPRTVITQECTSNQTNGPGEPEGEHKNEEREREVLPEIQKVHSPKVYWLKIAKPRALTGKVDYEYRILGQEIPKLRSLVSVERYCQEHNIEFTPDLLLTEDPTDSQTERNETMMEEEVCNVEIQIPKNFEAAMQSPERKQWEKSMTEEMNRMKERKIWQIVEAPSDTKIIGCRWIYAIKRDVNGTIKRFKSRLVAPGYGQIYGETYDEVFSPVVDFSVIRLLIIILVGIMGWLHIQLNIKSAYLYAKLHKTVYMKQPKGFMETGKDNHVCRLDRAIYGLHQSGREWHDELHNH